jgi:hypothetical protein
MNDLRQNPGCLGGLIRLFALNWIFDWLQGRVGFGRGGCSGMGCGAILLLIFVFMACSIFTGTDWLSFRF